jgi:hypothetical protein
VIEVAVAQDDGLEGLGGYSHPVEVADHPVRCDPGVEQDSASAAADVHLDECREPVLGTQEVDRRAAFGHLGRNHRNRRSCPRRW